MSDKKLSLSSHLIPGQFNDPITSTKSLPLVKRRFSAAKMLNKAKDTTKSILEKRLSLESKTSSEENLPEQDKRSISLTSLEQLIPDNDDTIQRKLSSKKKHYSLPIRRPFTIKKDTLDSSLSSFTTSSSTTTVPESSTAAAAAEADILSGTERPGSFATACDFRLAKEKRNEEFHALFKSVQPNDLLIEDYKCALLKDILLQGHLFISEHHVCFKSNIFGWVTNLVINFDEITEVEKKMTAKIIPNGITIATSTSKHVFASFLSRDQAYDQIVKIWDLSKKLNSVIPTALDENNSLYGETEDDDSIHEKKVPETIPIAPVNPVHYPDPITPKQRPRSVSDSNYRGRRDPIPQESSLKQEITPIIPIKKTRVCPCTINGDQHTYIALNETYHGSVEAMFKLLFNSGFVKGFLERYENFENVQTSLWQHSSREVIAQRRIKSSSGTKVVKTLFQEKKLHRKYPYYACVTTKKSMPDMPMGAVYSIQLRTCITRVSKEKVHLLVTFDIVFSKSGLISSIIEKNAADDQIRLYSHLHSILNRPSLVYELIDDVQLLQDLDFNDKSPKQIPNTTMPLSKPKYIIYYIGFLLVLLAHLITAFRLQSISYHLESVQPTVTKDTYWLNHNIDRIHDRLNQLQGETQEYLERIKKLK